MDRATAGDVARQAAVVFGAVFQTIGSGLAPAGTNVGELSDANRTLVVPAGYAFAIWGPIFLLCLAYAVYQALPAQRTDPLLRTIGWWTAGAFIGNGLWEVAFPREQYVVAQVLIVAILAFLLVAQAGIVRAARAEAFGRARTWLVAVPVALTLGWLTAATLVGFATTLVGTGVWERTGTVEAAVGAALLLVGAVLAVAVLRGSRGAPVAALVAYGFAVLWALVAVIVNQADDSALTTGAAAVAAVVVAAALAAGRARPRSRVSPQIA